MLNRDDLLTEIDILTTHLKEYKDALVNKDEEKLKQLLKEGRELKENSEL
jgi:prephenate dehydrogenase